jgi:hypothetical protein
MVFPGQWHIEKMTELYCVKKDHPVQDFHLIVEQCLNPISLILTTTLIFLFRIGFRYILGVL